MNEEKIHQMMIWLPKSVSSGQRSPGAQYQVQRQIKPQGTGTASGLSVRNGASKHGQKQQQESASVIRQQTLKTL
jgi:hypothetical protein